MNYRLHGACNGAVDRSKQHDCSNRGTEKIPHFGRFEEKLPEAMASFPRRSTTPRIVEVI
jgi:hypothetical protein